MTCTQIIDRIVIKPRDNKNTGAILQLQHRNLHCNIGRRGISFFKREGDGITPAGLWRMAYFLYRADKTPRPQSLLPGFKISKDDSWCDASGSRSYNQPLAFTVQNSKESLWRSDDLYDIIIVLDHNSLPAKRDKGSAVFIHVRNTTTAYTEGCLALDRQDILNLLKICDSKTEVLISP